MYETIMKKLTQIDPHALGISIDHLLLGYAKCFNTQKIGLNEKILPLIENCLFISTDDSNKFFEDLIVDMIDKKFMVKKPDSFLKILRKTNKEKFLKMLLLTSYDDSFTTYPFEQYDSLTENEKKIFVSFLLHYGVPKNEILIYLAVNYQSDLLKNLFKDPFFQFDDNIIIHFISDCSISPQTPLIHNLTSNDHLTFEHENLVYNESCDFYQLTGEEIIRLFKKHFPDFFGIIRVWKGLESYFIESKMEILSVSLQDVLRNEMNEDLHLYYEIDDSQFD